MKTTREKTATEAGGCPEMSRGVGELEAFQQVMPESLAFPTALATQLGAIWFASVVLFCVYRFHDREQAVITAGLLIAGTSIWRTIKIVAPVPRPDQPLIATSELPLLLQPAFDLAVVNSGPGFPSGHAVTTTVLYLSLARYLDVGTPRKRYTAAIFMISLVGFTRITLGVHYLVDVLAGAAIGHTLLLSFRWGMSHTTTPRPTAALTIGVVLASVCLLANLLIPPWSLWEFGLFAAGVSAFVWWEYDVVQSYYPDRLRQRR